MHNQSSLERTAGGILGRAATLSPPVMGLGSAVGSPAWSGAEPRGRKGFHHIWSTHEDLSWHFSGVIVTEDRKWRECFWLLPKIAYLRPVPLSHSVQHFTRLNCAPFSIDFARITCVKLRFVTHNEFDFTRLKQVAQLWQRPCKLSDFKGVGHFEAKF